MESYILLVRMDSDWLYRWFVNDDYGRCVGMSARAFFTESEAEDDLQLFLELVRGELAA